MKKRFTLLTAAVCFAGWLMGQSISPEVYSTAGEHSEASNGQISWTAGQPLDATIEGTAAIITQGFHQPDLITTDLEPEIVKSDYHISVYPNPASSHVYFEFEREDNSPMHVDLVDELGRILDSRFTVSRGETLDFDLSRVSLGTYYLRGRNNDGKVIKAVKVQKIF